MQVGLYGLQQLNSNSSIYDCLENNNVGKLIELSFNKYWQVSTLVSATLNLFGDFFFLEIIALIEFKIVQPRYSTVSFFEVNIWYLSVWQYVGNKVLKCMFYIKKFDIFIISEFNKICLLYRNVKCSKQHNPSTPFSMSVPTEVPNGHELFLVLTVCYSSAFYFIYSECECNEAGSQSSLCDKYSGVCSCKGLYVGTATSFKIEILPKLLLWVIMGFFGQIQHVYQSFSSKYWRPSTPFFLTSDGMCYLHEQLRGRNKTYQ